MRKFFIITVISVQHTPYFFPAFFVENIFERGIVFSYVWKYFELAMLNSVRSPPSFFATFFVGNIFELRIVLFYLWKYFGTRNGEFCTECPFFSDFTTEFWLVDMYFSRNNS